MTITLKLPDDADAGVFKWAAKCAYSTESEEYREPRTFARGKQRCEVKKNRSGGFVATVTWR